jgi:hypothetical protein
VTKELQLTAEACLVAENMNIPHFLDIKKGRQKKNVSWVSFWNQCLQWLRNSSWRILQKKYDFYYFRIHHKWLSKLPKSRYKFLWPALSRFKLYLAILQQTRRKVKNLSVKYEDLSSHLLEKLLHLWNIHRWTFQNEIKIPLLMFLSEIRTKITGHFCVHLYCPISLWYTPINSFWVRKSYQ